MKRLGKKEELCIGCGTCEEVCSNLYFKENNREKSAIRIENGADKQQKITVCSQCGKCVDICAIQAISQDKNGVVRIRKDLCTGCYACVAFCPEGAMIYNKELLVPIKCVACGSCAKKCPAGAIFLEEI